MLSERLILKVNFFLFFSSSHFYLQMYGLLVVIDMLDASCSKAWRNAIMNVYKPLSSAHQLTSSPAHI